MDAKINQIIGFSILLFSFGLVLSVCAFAAAEKNKEATYSSVNGFLYFGDVSGKYLTSVQREFPADLDTNKLAHAILEVLFQEPPPGLSPLFPSQASIRAVFVTENGSAYVDISPGLEGWLQLSAESELLAVYAIVNSLLLNIPEIKRVKLLIQGMEVETLAGHIDLNYFYKANMLIVR